MANIFLHYVRQIRNMNANKRKKQCNYWNTEPWMFIYSQCYKRNYAIFNKKRSNQTDSNSPLKSPASTTRDNICGRHGITTLKTNKLSLVHIKKLHPFSHRTLQIRSLPLHLLSPFYLRFRNTIHMRGKFILLQFQLAN